MVADIDNKMDILVARIAKVRRWLAAIAVLKVVAACMLFICIYTGVYVWLDHRLNFGVLDRITALLILIIGAVIVLYKLSRLLLVQISYTNAANYIENKNSFDQQLVTAMEFYENKADYTYSETLAEQLVVRICNDSETFRFDSTIRKWYGYVLAAVILFCMAIVGFYIKHNLAYFSTYLARLTIPTAAIEPISVVNLTSITGDFVAEPKSMLKFAADIQSTGHLTSGRIPENGKFVLEPLTGDSNEITPGKESLVYPVNREEGNPRLEVSKFFEQVGQYRYRFEAGPSHSQWHNIEIRESPKIENITAEVSLPDELDNNSTLENYTEQIKDNKLELIKASTVTLDVRAAEKLSKAKITGLDGQSDVKQLDGADNFTYTFTADKEGTIGFSLIDEKGLENKNVPDLEIKLKTDEPPEFKLISPETDYLATNVASIPIEFEVKDDFGLSSVRMSLELPEQQPIVTDIPVELGQKKLMFTHILELEDYDLEVGDSILFYVQATDVNTGIIPEHNYSGSDTYFIEVRPYQQFWHLMPGGGESTSPGIIPEGLMTVLEYTRAVVKKTWAIAGKQNVTSDDHSKLDFICDDVAYCSELLKTIRDDPENNFADTHKAVLNQVLNQYEKAMEYLSRHDASSALVPEKTAYRILRKFILELELQYNPPSSGQSSPQEKPDKVTLQESPEFIGFEKERIEAQMQNIRRNIEKLKREQKQLKTDFENFLEQNQKAKRQEKAQQEKKSSEDKQMAEQTQYGKSDSQQSKAGGEQEKQSSSQAQGDGSAKSTAESQQAQKSNASSVQSIGKKGDVKDIQSDRSTNKNANNSSNAEAILRMLQARQKALQDKTSKLNQDLEKIQQNPGTPAATASEKAQKHLNEAIETMEQFQDKLDEARYENEFENKAKGSVRLMDSAESALESAENALESGMTGGQEQQMTKKAKDMAEQLAEDAAALDESLTAVEREEMLARLKAAERLLESMTGANWAKIQKGGQKSGTGHVLTKDSTKAAETAKEISRLFWSIALDAQEHTEQPITDEPSDVRFHELENEFFENAAKYNRRFKE
jgi:hypothetical protein